MAYNILILGAAYAGSVGSRRLPPVESGKRREQIVRRNSPSSAVIATSWPGASSAVIFFDCGSDAGALP